MVNQKKKIKEIQEKILTPSPEAQKDIEEKTGLKVEIKKEVKTEYFYILYMQNGVHRLAVFGDLGIAKSNVKNWNEKGMKAVVVTGSQLLQLKSSK